MFREQLAFLRNHDYYSVSLDTWERCIADGIPLPGRPVIFTFDDGYEDFISNAVPLLEEFGFDATVFVVTGKVGATADWDTTSGPPLKLMDWEQLRAVRRRGFDVGSHTTCHVDLLALSDAEIVRDFSASCSILREQLYLDARHIAFPWGRSDIRVRSALTRGGCTMGLAAAGGLSSLHDDLMNLPRIEVSGYDHMQKFSDQLFVDGQKPAAAEPRRRVVVSSVDRAFGDVKPGVTAVVTSCGRQDLLARTLDSFFGFNTHDIDGMIVVEDGLVERNYSLMQKYHDRGITWIGTDRRVGQISAIDMAYSGVCTEFIFHFEDDWEFYGSGFIEKSLSVLQADPSCLQVWLRAFDDTNEHPLETEIKTLGGVAVKRLVYGHLGRWHGFSFNPGLRRTVDYRRLGSFGQHVTFDFDEPSASEAQLSRLYHDLGMYAVLLADNEGRGYVRHIGAQRHVDWRPADGSVIDLERRRSSVLMGNLVEASSQVSTLLNERDELRLKLGEVERTLTLLEDGRRRGEEEIVTLRLLLAQREGEIERLVRQHDATISRAALLERDLNDARENIHGVYNSTSWRITAPLRLIRQLQSKL